MDAGVIITGSHSHGATCMLPESLCPQNANCISRPGCRLVLSPHCIARRPLLHLAQARWDACTEILSWNLQSLEVLSDNKASRKAWVQIASLKLDSHTRALMVNSLTPWLAEGCQSMKYFEFIQRLLYNIFDREAIIDCPHVVLTLRIGKKVVVLRQTNVRWDPRTVSAPVLVCALAWCQWMSWVSLLMRPVLQSNCIEILFGNYLCYNQWARPSASSSPLLRDTRRAKADW